MLTQMGERVTSTSMWISLCCSMITCRQDCCQKTSAARKQSKFSDAISTFADEVGRIWNVISMGWCLWNVGKNDAMSFWMCQNFPDNSACHVTIVWKRIWRTLVMQWPLLVPDILPCLHYIPSLQCYSIVSKAQVEEVFNYIHCDIPDKKSCRFMMAENTAHGFVNMVLIWFCKWGVSTSLYQDVNQ